jgi:TRAP-type mannitol/chloroaromatic compound transport system substrate-binding protein
LAPSDDAPPGPIAGERRGREVETMSSIRMVALAGMIAGSALVAGGALAEDLRLAHWVPAQHPLQPTGLEPWAASIAAASNGRLNITIFPAQQLGAAPDHYDMARDGIADIAFVNPGYQAGRFPIIAHGEIPFHITNAKGGDQLDRAGYEPDWHLQGRGAVRADRPRAPGAPGRVPLARAVPADHDGLKRSG